jgi:hypothetical protein
MGFAMKLHAAVLVLALCWMVPAAADPLYEAGQLVKKGKKEQAIEYIDAYFAAQPRDAWGRNMTQLRFLKGTVLMDLRRYAEAMQVYQKLIQDYPDLPEPYNNLAALYAGQGRLEEARDLLERGMRTDPAYAAAFRNLNDIYARLSGRAYEQTLQTSKGGRPAPALIKELCDNYGRMANQSVGRQHVASGELGLLRDISKNRPSAGGAPSKVDIDEMAMESVLAEPELPPTFNNPAAVAPKPVPVSVQNAAVNAPPMRNVAQAAPLAEVKAKPVLTGADDKAVLAAVESWAANWSRKDAAAYLGAYARDFRVPNGMSRSHWASQRRERIGKPKSIKVEVQAPKVSFNDASHASVSFRQAYHSDNLQTSTRKTLLLVKSGGRWLIQEERVGS